MIKISINKIKNNPSNPRIIKDEKYKKLVKSLREFPQMLEKKPLICCTSEDGNYYVLGGNMRLKACKEVGIAEVPILLADDWTEEQKNEFIVKDNVSYGEWDWDVLANEWDSDQLKDWGLDIPIDKEINENDLFDIELPFYVPAELKPNISELAILEKTNDLIDKINSLKVEKQLKDVLLARASFFTDFNFQKIADYYHHSDNSVKKVFEDLGLVILSPKDALEKGFVEISNFALE